MEWDRRASKMTELIGKTIQEIWVSPGEHSLHFLTNAGWISYFAVGDCCSESWFADIYTPENILGEKILGIGDCPSIPSEDGLSRQEFDTVYGHKLIAAPGTALIAYRCSSNGYYGGWLEQIEKEYMNDKFPEYSWHFLPPAGSRQILTDWSA